MTAIEGQSSLDGPECPDCEDRMPVFVERDRDIWTNEPVEIWQCERCDLQFTIAMMEPTKAEQNQAADVEGGEDR